MLSPPLVSVIIPAYNSEQYIAETLESVLCQDYPEFDVIVVDDGSQDRTAQVMRQFCPPVVYIQQENRGPGAARNLGLRHASGKYIVFLDADDLLMPNKLRDQVDFLEKYDHVDIVYSNGYLFIRQPHGNESQVLFSQTNYLNKGLGSPVKSLPILAWGNAFPLHAAMSRRDCLEGSGGFDENRDLMVFADWELWFRLAQTCTFHYQDLPMVRYRILDSSISHDPDKLVRACLALEKKIATSLAFQSLSAVVQARFYYHLGVLLLLSGATNPALERFHKSVLLAPYALKIRTVYLAVRLFGEQIISLARLRDHFFAWRHRSQVFW